MHEELCHILCGDDPTWRYTFSDGRLFTSSLPQEFAEAQARAVETLDQTPITRIERYVAGAWETVQNV